MRNNITATAQDTRHTEPTCYYIYILRSVHRMHNTFEMHNVIKIVSEQSPEIEVAFIYNLLLKPM